MSPAAERIVALGAGRMGRGIAIAFAYAGHEVTLLDFKARGTAACERLLAEAREDIRASLSGLADLGVMTAVDGERVLARIGFAGEARAPDVLGGATLIFEGVPETLEAKRDTFARVCVLAPEDAILASTTSTILVTDLAAMVTRPERLLNAHWLNPAYVIPLVEISVHPGTAPALVERLRRLLESMGKVPVVCGPAPGYIVPRLQALIMNEAARMVEEGVATPEEIDKATRFGLGLRFASIGVLEFIDYGGNDILYHASRYLAGAVSAERYALPGIVDRFMHEGRNGLREGAGFFEYGGRDVTAYRKDVLARTLAMLGHFGLSRPPA